MNDLAAGRYPIREFARLTGVNPATLRAWERRYGIIQPHRSPKGHRFYSERQVDTVRQILYWLEKGYPIRQVKVLLQQPVSEQAPSEGMAYAHSDEWLQHQESLYNAILAFNQTGMEDLLNNGFATYPVAVYYQFCLVPVLEKLRSGSEPELVLTVFEHWLNRKLDAILQHQQRHNQGDPLVILASHEDARTECLIRACALGAAGIRVDCFSRDISPNDLALLADAIQANGLWLHFHASHQVATPLWQHYLATPSQRPGIRHFLSGHVPAPRTSRSDSHPTEQLAQPEEHASVHELNRLEQPLQQQLQQVISIIRTEHSLEGVSGTTDIHEAHVSKTHVSEASAAEANHSENGDVL